MPTQQRLQLSFIPEVEIELMREAFKQLPANVQAQGFERALQNRGLEIGLRRMVELGGNYRRREQ